MTVVTAIRGAEVMRGNAVRGRSLPRGGRVTQEAVRGSFHTGLSFTVYWNLSVIAQLPQRHHVI